MLQVLGRAVLHDTHPYDLYEQTRLLASMPQRHLVSLILNPGARWTWVVTFTLCPIYLGERDLSIHWVFWRRWTPDRTPHDIVLIRFISCDDNIKEKERRHLLQPLVLTERIFLSLYHDSVPTVTNALTSSYVLRNFKIIGNLKENK
jgi:hypothetical protein